MQDDLKVAGQGDRKGRLYNTPGTDQKRNIVEATLAVALPGAVAMPDLT